MIGKLEKSFYIILLVIFINRRVINICIHSPSKRKAQEHQYDVCISGADTFGQKVLKDLFIINDTNFMISIGI